MTLINHYEDCSRILLSCHVDRYPLLRDWHIDVNFMDYKNEVKVKLKQIINKTNETDVYHQ